MWICGGFNPFCLAFAYIVGSVSLQPGSTKQACPDMLLGRNKPNPYCSVIIQALFSTFKEKVSKPDKQPQVAKEGEPHQRVSQPLDKGEDPEN